MIGGFFVSGIASQKVIVRAIGPSLTGFGVPNALANPPLELRDKNGVVLSNDNWKDTQQAEIQTTGFAPSNDIESAIVTALAPVGYTAIVRSADGTPGVGLVEVCALD